MNKRLAPTTKENATSSPCVSVVCIAYNHVAFIADAIESFLGQKTDFRYEILIHDDASTDGTRAIIERYVARYPKLIRAILQTENQYSQGNRPLLICLPYCRGEFISICEGDDYWTDPEKLQIQVNQLRLHPACELSFHAAETVYADARRRSHRSHWHGPQNQVIPFEKVLEGSGGLCPTASLMFRRRVLEEVPEWYKRTPVGDYYLQVLGSLAGGALYIGRSMSTYRRFATGSHSQRAERCVTGKSDLAPLELLMARRFDSMHELSNWLPRRFQPSIDVQIANLKFAMAKIYLRTRRYPKFRKLMDDLKKSGAKPRRSDQYWMYYGARFAPRTASLIFRTCRSMWLAIRGMANGIRRRGKIAAN